MTQEVTSYSSYSISFFFFFFFTKWRPCFCHSWLYGQDINDWGCQWTGCQYTFTPHLIRKIWGYILKASPYSMNSSIVLKNLTEQASVRSKCSICLEYFFPSGKYLNHWFLLVISMNRKQDLAKKEQTQVSWPSWGSINIWYWLLPKTKKHHPLDSNISIRANFLKILL